jgi:ABC-2 type transport system permease protein
MPAALDRYDSSQTGLQFVEEAKALWAYRHLVRELVVRDLKVRYKRSALGVAWTMLGPLLHMASLAFAFSFLMRFQIENYPVYLLAGSLFWSFFSQATGHAANLSIEALEITKRVYVPRSAFVASAVAGAALNLVLSLLPLLVIVLVTGHPVHATWLFLPVSILIGAAFTAGVSLLVFTLSMRFIDVRDTYLVLLGPWFFLTPIAYPKSILPAAAQLVVRYNPMTYLVEVFRAPLYDGWLPGSNTLLFAVLAAVSSLALGWSFYASRVESYAARS